MRIIIDNYNVECFENVVDYKYGRLQIWSITNIGLQTILRMCL
jgi:hypothetical protein